MSIAYSWQNRLGVASPQTNSFTISTGTSTTMGCQICASFPSQIMEKNPGKRFGDSDRKCVACGGNCGRPSLLDLFSGAGGAARGYQLAGFCVLGVDHRQQPRYVGCEFIQTDALEYVREHGHEYDVIHASPPCQAYTSLKSMWNSRQHPDLVAPTRILLKLTGRPYIIENVPGSPLKANVMICGTMFNLGVGDAELWRHRYFETTFTVGLTPLCQHRQQKRVIGVYGGHGRDRRRVITVVGNSGGKSVRDGIRQFSVAERREAMQIDWMTMAELSQAIPPVYTEFIGRQIVQHFQRDR